MAHRATSTSDPKSPPPAPAPCRRYVQSYIKNCFGTGISIWVQSGD